jgi:glycosyltransferase involved in cell wall biosynthesis
MKIAFYGNVCNNMFSMCDALRKFTTHDCHLYLPSNLDFHNLPENDFPEFENNYPNWIHRGKEFNHFSILKPWNKNILSELRQYDVVFLSSLSIIFSPFLRGQIVIFYSTGSDLTIVPFSKLYKYFYTHNLFTWLKALFIPKLQKWGINSATYIISQPFEPFVKALKVLKIPKEKIDESYFPIIINTDIFKYRSNSLEMISPRNRELFSKSDFKIFSPTRIVANNSKEMQMTGQNKGTDILIKAFHMFVHNNPESFAGLYLINRKYNDSGEVDYIKNLIKELDLNDKVYWLESNNACGFTRNELINIYSISDIIADEFAAGWFGSICVEAFACSKPVLSYVDEKAMSKIYQYHPFLSSLSVKRISQLIEICYLEPEFRKKQGILGREWAIQYHSPSSAAKIYIENLNKIFNIETTGLENYKF